MTANTYPTAETVRATPHGLECRYCGHTVDEDTTITRYRHQGTGHYRCDPAARVTHENQLSDSMIRP